MNKAILITVVLIGFTCTAYSQKYIDSLLAEKPKMLKPEDVTFDIYDSINAYFLSSKMVFWFKVRLDPIEERKHIKTYFLVDKVFFNKGLFGVLVYNKSTTFEYINKLIIMDRDGYIFEIIAVNDQRYRTLEEVKQHGSLVYQREK